MERSGSIPTVVSHSGCHTGEHAITVESEQRAKSGKRGMQESREVGRVSDSSSSNDEFAISKKC